MEKTIARWARLPWAYAGLALLALSVVATRIYQLDHSLWYDEAWVANSLMGQSWRDVFFYPDWLQTTPPGFLVLARSLVLWLGPQNWVLHLPSLFFGIAGIALITWLGWRELSPAQGLWMGLVGSISGLMVALSQELKQYSADFFVAALLSCYLMNWKRLPAKWVLWGTPLLFGLLFLLSTPSVFFLPCALLLLLLEREELGVAKKWLAALGLYWAAAAGLLIAATYFYFLAPNRDAVLTEFWSVCFLDWKHPEELLTLLRRNVKTLLSQALDTPLASSPLSGSGSANVFLMVIVPAAACVALFARRSAGLRLASCAVLPLAVGMAANLAGVYPLCEYRFAPFFLPAVLLLHGLAWEIFQAGPRLALVAHSALGCALLASAFFALDAKLWKPRVETFFEPAFAVLRQERKLSETLYIHGFLQEQFKFYSRRHPEQRQNSLPSQTALGCCPRGMDNFRSFEDPIPFRDEFSLLLARSGTQPFWLFYGRQPKAMNLPRREEWVHLKLLSALGCTQRLGREYRDIALYQFACPAEALSRYASFPLEQKADDPHPEVP